MSEMGPHSAPTAPKKPTARSRISNGHDVLAGVDQRTAIARRYRDIVEAVSLDAPFPRAQKIGRSHHATVPAGTSFPAVSREPCNIDPPTSSYAIMRRACPYQW